MDSEHNTGFKDAFGDDSVTLEDAVRISDELLSRPTAFQDAEAFFADLQISSPSLFKMIVDAVQELSAMPGAHYLRFPFSPNHVDTNSTPSQAFPNAATDPILVFDTDGNSWYQCTHCPKQYARQGRARDCRNTAFNIKPYNCTGQCGDASCTKSFATRELLLRHQKEERVNCSNCGAPGSKQNLRRHMKSCMKGE